MVHGIAVPSCDLMGIHICRSSAPQELLSPSAQPEPRCNRVSGALPIADSLRFQNGGLVLAQLLGERRLFAQEPGDRYDGLQLFRHCGRQVGQRKLVEEVLASGAQRTSEPGTFRKSTVDSNMRFVFAISPQPHQLQSLASPACTILSNPAGSMRQSEVDGLWQEKSLNCLREVRGARIKQRSSTMTNQTMAGLLMP